MSEPLHIDDTLTIPADCLTWKAVRSSGPGGQHVNKTSTCVELRFSLSECGLFEEKVLARLKKLAGSKLIGDEVILMTSQTSRDQSRNLEDAREKLRQLISKALKEPKPRRPTKPSKAVHEKRVEEKRKRSVTKKFRASARFEE